MNNTLTKNSYFKVSSEPGYDLFSLQLLGDAGGGGLVEIKFTKCSNQ